MAELTEQQGPARRPDLGQRHADGEAELDHEQQQPALSRPVASACRPGPTDSGRGRRRLAMPRAAAISSDHIIGISTTRPGPSLNWSGPMVGQRHHREGDGEQAELGEGGDGAEAGRGRRGGAGDRSGSWHVSLRPGGPRRADSRSSRSVSGPPAGGQCTSIPSHRRFINDRDMGNLLHSMQHCSRRDRPAARAVPAAPAALEKTA